MAGENADLERQPMIGISARAEVTRVCSDCHTWSGLDRSTFVQLRLPTLHFVATKTPFLMPVDLSLLAGQLPANIRFQHLNENISLVLSLEILDLPRKSLVTVHLTLAIRCRVF